MMNMELMLVLQSQFKESLGMHTVPALHFWVDLMSINRAMFVVKGIMDMDHRSVFTCRLVYILQKPGVQ